MWRKFAHKFIMTEHMKVHLGEIPYDCDVWKMIYTDMYTD